MKNPLLNFFRALACAMAFAFSGCGGDPNALPKDYVPPKPKLEVEIKPETPTAEVPETPVFIPPPPPVQTAVPAPVQPTQENKNQNMILPPPEILQQPYRPRKK